jgi:hypothetical protein
MSAPINAAYFAALTAQVNASNSCAELQAVTTSALESILATQTAATAQLATITPMLALLMPPTTPTEVITYIQTFITAYLTPQLVPAVTLAAQLAATIAAIAALTAAIESKAAQFASCTITIPT